MTSNAQPLVSVVITNFNYERFLAEAVESALAQTYPNVELIVVDDGSTDNSRDVLARFLEQGTCVFKENGGQASAFNEAARYIGGDIVIFLDADDALFPETAGRVVRCMCRAPGTVKVQYRLRVVDADGADTGRCLPPLGVELAEGDVSADALVRPHDLAYPPTSGNAFDAAALKRLLPIPDDHRDFADMYLLNLVPLLGPIATLDGVGGSYRIHDRNSFHSDALDLARVRKLLVRNAAAERHLRELAISTRGVRAPSTTRPASVTDLAQRMISLRLDPHQHPIDGDTRTGLATLGAWAAATRQHPSRGSRVLYPFWFAAMAVAPRRAAAWFAERLHRSWRTASQRAPAP